MLLISHHDLGHVEGLQAAESKWFPEHPLGQMIQAVPHVVEVDADQLGRQEDDHL